MRWKAVSGWLHPRQFCLLFFIIAAVPGSFTGGLWAAIGIGGGVVLCMLTAGTARIFPKPDPCFAGSLAMALALIALLNGRSTDAGLSWALWLRLVSIFIPLALLSSPLLLEVCRHPAFTKAMTIAMMTGALALGCELAAGAPLLKLIRGHGAPLTEYNRGLSYEVLLAFPVMAGILCPLFPEESFKRRHMIATLFVIFLLFPASLTESRAARLALLAGLAVTAFAYFRPNFACRCLKVLLVMLPLWPFAAQYIFCAHEAWLKFLPDSWRARMEIWDYMSYRIMEHPWLGWGLGTSHLLPFKFPDGSRYVFTVIPAAHPHNVMIELWVELGVPGLALGMMFAFLMLSKIKALPERQRPFAWGAFMAGLCLSLVAYDFWTDSLMAAFALTGVAFAQNALPAAQKSQGELAN